MTEKDFLTKTLTDTVLTRTQFPEMERGIGWDCCISRRSEHRFESRRSCGQILC